MLTAKTFCKTSNAAKMEKIASAGANCVKSDRKETLIMDLDKAMEGDIAKRKMDKFRRASKMVAPARSIHERNTARRSPPTRSRTDRMSDDWIMNSNAL
mmetsp:Transcript_57381/g.64088  ORF Transcript_57381/g.64088 Transcript_57381/m.64088 type:complete len:99 (-) Transcript_57381:906-1202(-)